MNTEETTSKEDHAADSLEAVDSKPAVVVSKPMILVKNTRKVPFHLQLLNGVDYGPEYPARVCVTRTPVRLDDGSKGMKEQEKPVPAVVEWAPGEEKLVPVSFADIAQFQTAKNARIITVKRT